jgi:hypothetical protein
VEKHPGQVNGGYKYISIAKMEDPQDTAIREKPRETNR